GFGDSSGSGLDQPPVRFFESFTNIPAVRDNIRQTAIDLLALEQALAAGLDLSEFAPLFGGGAPIFDGAKVSFLGTSLGTVIGGPFLAVTPEVKVAVLNVPGGGVGNNIIANSAQIGGELFTLALLLEFGGAVSSDALNRFHPILNLAQLAVDPADPM